MYWLVKSEPNEYSFQDLLKDGITSWTGVRNYAARNNLRAMDVGDLCLFYHSVDDKEVVGIAKVSKLAYPDPTSDVPDRWSAVDLQPVKIVKAPVSLQAIKENKKLESLALVKNSRLSVMPVAEDHWNEILHMAKTKLV